MLTRPASTTVFCDPSTLAMLRGSMPEFRQARPRDVQVHHLALLTVDRDLAHAIHEHQLALDLVGVS
jgi:hypothetical protein